jgi:hypothetical protein
MVYQTLIEEITNKLLEAVRFSPELVKDFASNPDITRDIAFHQDTEIPYEKGIKVLENPRYAGDLILAQALKDVPNKAVIGIGSRMAWPERTNAAVELTRMSNAPYNIKMSPKYSFESSSSSSVSPRIKAITLRNFKDILADMTIPKTIAHEAAHIDQIHKGLTYDDYSSDPFFRIKTERDADTSAYKLLRGIKKNATPEDTTDHPVLPFLIGDALRVSKNMNSIGNFSSSAARSFSKYLTQKEYDRTSGALGAWSDAYQDRIRLGQL